MNRDHVLELIQRNEAELRELGVVGLSLYGSTARGEAGPNSDVDVAVEFEDLASGLQTFGRLDLVRERLTAILDARVDVIPEPTLSGPIKTALERDRLRAF